MVDLNALRTNQIVIVGAVAVAFLLGAGPGLVLLALLALCMAIGVAFPGNGPIQLLYRTVLLPVGVVKPSREPGRSAPHRFAQGMGTACLALSTALLLAGFDFTGWALAFLVMALALVNLVFGFCAGCFIFLHLNRLRAGTHA